MVFSGAVETVAVVAVGAMAVAVAELTFATGVLRAATLRGWDGLLIGSAYVFRCKKERPPFLTGVLLTRG
jgi:hypothetical protein